MAGKARIIPIALVVPLLVAAYPLTSAANCAGTTTGIAPLTDLGPGTYHGKEGGLYPGGVSERPLAHTQLGVALAHLAVPRTMQGAPDPVSGKLVLLSIGMSNTNQEFARFQQLANADPARDPHLVVVNGAVGGQDAPRIADPDAPYWAMVDERLTQGGVAPPQVQAVWLKEAIAGPNAAFPQEAERLESDLREISQILKVRFPNLFLVYLSSRTYAGYASTNLNPEPHAYESGFSVKWLVESQIDGTYPLVDPERGVVAPWLSWGPYLWADGLEGRDVDDLVWTCADFVQDGTHPSTSGRQKVADLLLEFVHTDETARLWYTNVP